MYYIMYNYFTFIQLDKNRIKIFLTSQLFSFGKSLMVDFNN